jgi:hypothetical protein
MDKPSAAAAVFFTALLLWGVVAFDDYGAAVDEPLYNQRGELTVKYVLYGDRTLLSLPWRFYGPVLEVPAYLLERYLGLEDIRDILLLRHLFVFLVFLAGSIFFYLFCRMHFRSGWMGLAGGVLLASSPRILSDSFYNSKDIGFMSLFIVSMYTMAVFVERKSVVACILHAVATAAAIDVRVMGILLPALTVLLMAIDILRRSGGFVVRSREAALLLLYLLLTPLLVILFWPLLWENPAGTFVDAFKYCSDFPNHIPIFYLGNYIAEGPPWHYVPVWVFITTPPLFMFLFLIGILHYVKGVIAKRLPAEGGPGAGERIVVLLWLIAPVLTAILLDSRLYGGWRQVYFIYPAFLVVCLSGLRQVGPRLKRWALERRISPVRIFVVAFLLAGVLEVPYSLATYHPHEYAYFNPLVGGLGVSRQYFDVDYLGRSLRAGAEYVLDMRGPGAVKVCFRPEWGAREAIILPADDRKRLDVVPCAKAEYLVTNYYLHPGGYPARMVFSVEAGGGVISGVYLLTAPESGQVPL